MKGPSEITGTAFLHPFFCSDFTVRKFAHQSKGDKVAAIRVQNIHLIALRISTFWRNHLSSLHSGAVLRRTQTETKDPVYHWSDGPQVWNAKCVTITGSLTTLNFCSGCYTYNGDSWRLVAEVCSFNID